MQDVLPLSRASSDPRLVARLHSSPMLARADSADLPELTDPEIIHKVVKKIRGIYGSCITGESLDVMHMLGSIQVSQLPPLQWHCYKPSLSKALANDNFTLKSTHKYVLDHIWYKVKANSSIHHRPQRGQVSQHQMLDDAAESVSVRMCAALDMSCLRLHCRNTAQAGIACLTHERVDWM